MSQVVDMFTRQPHQNVPVPPFKRPDDIEVRFAEDKPEVRDHVLNIIKAVDALEKVDGWRLADVITNEDHSFYMSIRDMLALAGAGIGVIHKKATEEQAKVIQEAFGGA